MHTDIEGPMQTKTKNGTRFFITFTEDTSGYVWIQFMKHKSEASNALKSYLAWIENHTGKTVKTLRSDNDTVYMATNFTDVLRKRGITHETSAQYSQWQNGVAERMNRTLVEMARSNLQHAELPNVWWAEAVNTAAFI